MMVVGKKVKSIIVILAWVLAAAAFGFTLLQILNPSEHTVEKSVYNAQISSTIDYNVRLMDTPVYSGARDADPAKYYIMPFTDYITLDCNYSLNGNAAADIKANSYITAFLVSYINEGDQEEILWQKEYTLAESKVSETTDNGISGTSSVSIDFTEYNTLIDQIEDLYSYKTNYYLMVVYTTEFSVNNDQVTEEKIVQPYLRINIEDLLFEIEENNYLTEDIIITKPVVVTDEVDFDIVIIGGTIFVLLAVLAMLLPTKILKGVTLSDEAKVIKQINLKYGDRIINILDKPVISNNTVRVEGIEDIAKIADETAQPIFNVSAENETYYYVTNNGVLYYMMLKTK